MMSPPRPPPLPPPFPVNAKKRAGPFREPESRGQGWGAGGTAAVSSGGQDAWVGSREWNVAGSQEQRIRGLRLCGGVRREGHLAGSREENNCDRMRPGLQNAVSVEIIPHPWQSFPVFCLPMDREREGCRGQNDAARLSRPALHNPPPQSHVDGVGRVGFLS